MKSVTSSANGVTFLLPESYAQRLAPIDGISSVTWANWFGAYYQDPNDFFAQFAVNAETYFDLYPEVQITQGDMDAFFRERTAAVVGVLITTWIVPAITKTSYVPFFLLGASLVPLALAAVWFLGQRIEPVKPH